MASTDNNFSEALTTWKQINLGELQKTLDAQGIEIVQNQKDSLVSRKVLADRTRDFKKLPDDEKLTEFKTLLKAYQTEIDNLTRRTKTSETVFLNAYKILAEAPDPYPLLDAAVDQTVKVAEAQALEAQVQRLREENAELKRTVNDLSSADAAKKRAEAKVAALEQKMEDSIQERVTQKEAELNATWDEKILNFEERERESQRQLALVKNQLKELRMSNETHQAKLLDHSQRQDAEVVSKLAELDMLAGDLERANSRVATVERRNELLRAEIEAVRSGHEGDNRVKALENRVNELETEATRLLRALDTQKSLLADTEFDTKRKLDNLSKDLHIKSTECENLRAKLNQYSDYDEVKRELEIMKYVEFAALDPEGDEDDIQLPNPNAEKANKHQAKSLETLMASKNRRLEEELTRFRILHSELEESFRSVSEELATCRADLDKEKVLNDRLENDLLHVNKHMGRPSERLSGTSTPAVPDPLADLNIGGDAPVRTTPIPFTSAADTSILPIVTSQRDRFRQRNAELEEELRKQFDIISELRTEIKTLQADNLKLYEKVRYMQSYRDDSSSTLTAGPSSFTPSNHPLTRSQANGNRTDDLGKYKQLYEQTMNPFEAFRGREAARAVQALNPLERGVLTVTRAILGNRRTRLFFIAYAGALHLLVLFTSYECATAGKAPTVVPVAH